MSKPLNACWTVTAVAAWQNFPAVSGSNAGAAYWYSERKLVEKVAWGDYNHELRRPLANERLAV
jgi:hypothetical protein